MFDSFFIRDLIIYGALFALVVFISKQYNLWGVRKATSKTKVDVQPDSTVIQSMMNNGIYGLYIENNNGTLTAYCVGGYFSDSISIQVSLSEVQ